MMRTLIVWCWLGAVLPLFGQFSHIAPDLAWNDAGHAYLGLVNPNQTAVDVHVSVYDASGLLLNDVSLTLAAHQRQEWPASELVSFRHVASVAWARVDASAALSGYVRWQAVGGTENAPAGIAYKRNDAGRTSIAPLSQVKGVEVWVPQASDVDGEFMPSTVVTNAGGGSGIARNNPVQAIEPEDEDELPRKQLDPQDIPAFGNPFQQTVLSYGELFKDQPGLLWDHITSEDSLELAAVQHFRGVPGKQQGYASLTLPRTANREMIIAPMQPNEEGYWNKIVLINTYPGRLPVEIDAYYEGGVSRRFSYDFEPYQKLVLDVDAPTQLEELPGNFRWLRVRPFEGGLIGYQLFGSEMGLSAGAAEAAIYPSGNSTLPHTPSNEQLQTRIGIVNLNEIYVPYYVAGFNDSGRIVEIVTMETVGPYDKVSFTTEEIFGEKASEVTWCRVGANRNHVMSFATIEARDGSALAGFQGFSHIAHDAEIFAADFEHLDYITLDQQNWYGQRFILPARDTFVLRRNYYSADAQKPDPGTVFQEWAWDAQAGYFYFGYEPVYQDHILLDGTPDAVVYWSDYIEVPPQAGPYYMSFWMRFINPLDTTTDSQYGMVWREEGSETAHWFGLRGIVLEQPPVWISDCWFDLPWRDLEVTVTQWIPFERQLPASLGGKRIQVGYYYKYLPDSSRENAPYMFIDNVRIGVKQLEMSQDFELDGGGTVTIPLEGALEQ